MFRLFSRAAQLSSADRRSKHPHKHLSPRRRAFLEPLEDRSLLAVDFLAAENFGVGNGTYSVSTGDFNGDGRLDLATAEFNSNNVSVLLGSGTGSFGAATNFTVGTNPASVTTGDFNGDGKLDLAAGNWGSNNLSVLLGNGTGGFGAAIHYVVGNNPLSVTTGDFNADGKLDLATANIGSDSLSVLLGTGTGSFGTATNLAVAQDPRSVTTGDFNGDGKLDLAAANAGDNNVSVLFGTGTGSFSAATNFFVGGNYPISVTARDFNGDGKLDLATSNSNSNTVSVLLGTGSGSFIASTSFAVGASFPFSVTSEDFNGDGKLDLATANQSGTVSVLVGTGTGSFGTPTNFAVGSAPNSVKAGDFNRDGKPDLAVANFSSNDVSVLINNAVFPQYSGFAPATNFSGVSNPHDVTTGDFNGDGKLDLAAPNNTRPGSVSVMLGAGTGSFGAATTFEGGDYPEGVTNGDFDGDGKLDLVLVSWNPVGLSVLLGTGTGSFGTATNFGGGRNIMSVTTGDYNGDGKLDLATVAINNNIVMVLLGTGTGSFGTPTDFPAGSSPSAVTAGDFNGDGKLDLVTASNNFAGAVNVLLGTGTGSFAAPISFTVGSYPHSVTTGDFNRDGKLDLATADYNSDNVSVLLGNGTGSFGVAMNFAVGTNPTSVTTGDFNGDGKLDLATANSSFDGTVSVLLGTGTGTFGAATNLVVGSYPESVAIGDFNGDGRLDLVTANYGYASNNLSVLINNVIPANSAPTDLSLSPSSVAESQVSGTVVGNFSTSDPDTGDTFTYSMVTGDGSEDNGSFSIVGNALTTNAVFDYEVKNSYTIRVRTTDAAGLWYEKVFNVTVTDVNLAPTDILANTGSFVEDYTYPDGTYAALLTAVDGEAPAGPFTFSLVAGAGSTDNGSFSISGNSMVTHNARFDYETSPIWSVLVRVTDAGGLWFDKVITGAVADVNLAPTDIGLSDLTAPENEPSGTLVGTFTSVDPEAPSAPFTYSLVTGDGSADNSSFVIVGNALKTNTTFNYEVKNNYSIRVRTTDQGGEWYEEPLTITVTNVNEAPTDLSLSNNSVAENLSPGTTVGNFTTTDPDLETTFTYSLVAGPSSTDNGSFAIVGDTLQTNALFDYEAKNSYAIRVRTIDQSGAWYDEPFTVSVVNVNDVGPQVVLTNKVTALPEDTVTTPRIKVADIQVIDDGAGINSLFVSGGAQLFEIDGSVLYLKAGTSLNHETNPTLFASVLVDDATGSTTDYGDSLSISVTDVNELPVFDPVNASMLDPAFGPNHTGKILTNLGGTDEAFGVAVDSLGRSVVVGYSDSTGGGDFAIARYNLDGTLDATFGTNGIVKTDFGAGLFDAAFGVAIQPADGKIVVVGTTMASGGGDFAIARYNTDGSLDTSFGNSGIAIHAIGSGYDKAVNVAILNDGRIVVSGYGQSLGADFAAMRLQSDGSLDTSFGSGGKVITDFGNRTEDAYGLAVDPNDGSLYLAGEAYNGFNWNFALLKYTATGQLDSSFGTGGKVTTDFGGAHDIAWDLALLPDGRLLAGGYSYSGSNVSFALARYTSTGQLDTTFGTNGQTTTLLGTSLHDLYREAALLVMPNNQLVLAGSATTSGTEIFITARYSANGSLDTSFGTAGLLAVDFGGTVNAFGAAAVQSDGKIVLAGFANPGSNDDFALARLGGGVTVDRTTLDEGQAVTLSGTFTDPDAGDTHRVAIAWGDGETTTVDLLAGEFYFSSTHTYLDDSAASTFQIQAVLTDLAGGSDSESVQVTAANVSPLVNAGPDQATTLSASVIFAGSFIDPGTLDTHTIAWDFGDGTTAADTLTPTHSYNALGEYSATLTVTDDNGGVGIDTMTVFVNELPSLVVTTASDVVTPYDGLTSLREALAYAAVLPGADSITFGDGSALTGGTDFTDAAADTIILGGTELTINSDATIAGPGADLLTVSGNNASRVFYVNVGITAELLDVTIRGGNAYSGGGVRNDGTLTISASTFSGNNATYGGGVYNPGGTLTISASTFSGNNATYGGGGGVLSNGVLTISASTFSGNNAASGGGVLGYGTLTISASTFSGNNAIYGSGGVLNFGNLTASNSIIAGNSTDLAGNAVAAAFNNLIGDPASAGGIVHGMHGNIVGDGAGNLLPIAQILNPTLANNGGPTQTHALVTGSPAINAGDNSRATINGQIGSTPLTTDQRGSGFARIVGPAVDIGAYEIQNQLPSVTPSTFELPENASNGSTVGQVLASDLDAGQILSFSITHGNESGRFAIDENGLITVADASQLDYETNPIFILAVKAMDNGEATLSDTEEITVHLTNVNEPPVAEDDLLAASDEDAMQTISFGSLLTNDTDVDSLAGDLTITAVDVAVGGTVEIVGTDVIFTPTLNFNGPASFEYTLTDGSLSDTGLVTFKITPVNDPPVAEDDLLAASDEEAVRTISFDSLLTNDTDVDNLAGDLTITAVDVAVGGTVEIVGTDVIFTPTLNFTGAASFEYTLSDGDLSDTGLVTFEITPVNDPPVLVEVGDQVATELIELTFTATAMDVDLPSQSLIFSLVGAPEGATITADGFFSWTPTDPQGPNSYAFDVVVSDGVLTDSETITVLVSGVDNSPRVFEAESSVMWHNTGVLTADGWSATPATDSRGFLAFGPYTTNIVAGLSEATFRLMVGDNSGSNVQAVRIDVYDDTLGQVLINRTILSSQFTAANTYQDFSLIFEAAAGHMFEFRTFWFDNVFTCLDKVTVEPTTVAPPNARVFQAETEFYHQQGQATADGWSATPATDNAGYLAYGPYTTEFSAGLNQATFRLMIDDVSGANLAVARIDVYDATAGGVLVSRTISRSEFTSANTYQDFSLIFDYVAGHKMEFRTFWFDNVFTCLDSVTVEPTTVAPPAVRVFQAETEFNHLLGQATADGWSATSLTDDAGYLAYGPYTTEFSAGLNQATFRLMIDDVSGANLAVARIDVYDATAGGVLVSRTISRSEFTSANTYQDFSLIFDYVAGHKMEFRTFWFDNVFTCLDSVTVEPTTVAPPTTRIFQAETEFYHQLGQATADGWSATPATDNAGYLAYGPYTTEVTAGLKQATFRLKVDSLSGPSVSVVRIDVYDDTAGGVVTNRVIQLSDFLTANSYHDFSLTFTAVAGHMYEFRTYWFDLASVDLDKVTIEPVVGAALRLFPASNGAHANGETLTPDELNETVTAAVARLGTAGLDASSIRSIPVEFADLPDALLGFHDEAHGRILIDNDAAGMGWYFDSTPFTDEEFASSRPQPLGVDLLTVVLHEFGHELGFDDERENSHGIMAALLPPGTRRDFSTAVAKSLLDLAE